MNKSPQRPPAFNDDSESTLIKTMAFLILSKYISNKRGFLLKKVKRRVNISTRVAKL